MTSEIALWAATSSAVALTGLLFTASIVLKSARSRFWAASMFLILLRLILAHASPHLEAALPLAKTLARLFSGTATMLFAWGAAYPEVLPSRRRYFFPALAAISLTAFMSLTGVDPAFAVLPLEWTAAFFAIRALYAARPHNGAMKFALILLFFRSATHPAAYAYKMSEEFLLAFSLFFWLVPALAAFLSLVGEIAGKKSGPSPVQGRNPFGERDGPLPVIIAEAGTGAIIDANSHARALFGMGEGDLSGTDLWELAGAGQGEALRENFSSSGQKPFHTSLIKGDGQKEDVLVTLEEKENGGRLLWRIGISPLDRPYANGARPAHSRAAAYAHDLKNLLQTIVSSSDHLSTKLGKDEKGLKAITEAARRSDNLIMRLMDESGTEWGERTILPEDMAAGLENLIMPTLPPGVSLRAKAYGGLVRVTGDPAELVRAAVNLLVNARESVNGEKGIITLAIESGEGTLTLTVEDDGPGVPEGERETVFAPGSSKKGENRGLGLAIVHDTASSFGGTVTCGVSRTLGGASFKMTVPVVTFPEERKASVIVADADDAARAEICRTLKMAGHRVRSTPSGDEAIELLGRDGAAADFLVAGQAIRGLGGRALYETAKKISPGLTIIVTGEIPDEESRRGALGAGADFFMAKKGSTDELAAMVSRSVTAKPF